MIAGLVQNTSLSYRDVEDLTVAELEGLYDGISKNNESGESKETLTGVSAVEALQAMGGGL